MSPSGGALPRLAPLLIVLAALLPSLAAPGSLGAPVLSDTGAVLGYVHRGGGLEDWTGPQYGMSIVRFWRPLVTGSLALQEAWTGIDPLPLRLFNLACHALTALLVAALARRLGAGGGGALAAGCLAALYPEHGGAVTWAVGRVDSLCAPFFLGAAWLALGSTAPRDGSTGLAPALGACVAAFLACATKEVAFVLPAWLGLLALGRGDGPRTWLRTVLPVALVCLLAFVLRRLALGVWVGGYPPPGPPDLASVARAARTLGGALLGAYGVCALPLVLIAVGPCLRLRAFALAVAAAGVAALPLYGLLQGGVLEPQNVRTLYLADLTLALSLGLIPATIRGPRLALALVPLLVLAGLRGAAAVADAREWGAAGEEAGAVVEEIRAQVAEFAPSERPLLRYGIPRHHGGAYCLAWGVADRFRAPFPATPRPVWPVRPLFDAPPEVGVRRDTVVAPRARLVDPFSDQGRGAELLPVSVGGERGFGTLVLDRSIAEEPDATPVLEVWESSPLPPDTLFEFVVYTELGYGAGTWHDAGPGVLVPLPGAAELPEGTPGEARVRLVSLRQVLLAPGPVAGLSWNLLQAADVGAQEALLEVRAVAPDGRLLAASRPLPLSWSDTLVADLTP